MLGRIHDTASMLSQLLISTLGDNKNQFNIYSHYGSRSCLCLYLESAVLLRMLNYELPFRNNGIAVRFHCGSRSVNDSSKEMVFTPYPEPQFISKSP